MFLLFIIRSTPSEMFHWIGFYLEHIRGFTTMRYINRLFTYLLYLRLCHNKLLMHNLLFSVVLILLHGFQATDEAAQQLDKLKIPWVNWRELLLKFMLFCILKADGSTSCKQVSGTVFWWPCTCGFLRPKKLEQVVYVLTLSVLYCVCCICYASLATLTL